jgi:hypothetical protein
MKIEERGDSCFVDVSFMGEYPSDVRRLQVRAGERIIWEINREGSTGQLHWLTLREGANAATFTEAYAGTYKTTVPEGAPTFSLDRGVKYRVLAWDDWGWASRGTCVLF